jgi:hypothetical protein
MTTLDDLKQTRRKTRAAEAAAAQAVTRAQKEVADKLFDVRECERPVEAARDRKALDAATLVLESTKKDHTLALKRLADRQGEHAYAEMQASVAAAAVVQAVDQILTDEIAARAKKVDDLLNEAKRLGTALKYFAVAAEVNAARIVQPSTLRVLDRLSLPLVNAMDIPIDLASSGDVTQFRDWAAQREQMIAGTTSDATPLEAA